MSANKTGGPAFPNVDSRDNPNFPGQREIYASTGMSLRAWLAGHALAGIAANPMAIECGEEMTKKMGQGWRGQLAVELADSTLRALDK